MAKAMSVVSRSVTSETAISGPAEMTSTRSADRENSQYSDAPKRTQRRASKLQVAAYDLTDEEDPDDSQLTEETQAHLILRLGHAKQMVPVSVRVDRDVLGWLKNKGGGHLERINDILTHSMEAERRAASGD
jgi:uncharacterized protein (DUF4415 family)